MAAMTTVIASVVRRTAMGDEGRSCCRVSRRCARRCRRDLAVVVAAVVVVVVFAVVVVVVVVVIVVVVAAAVTMLSLYPQAARIKFGVPRRRGGWLPYFMAFDACLIFVMFAALIHTVSPGSSWVSPTHGKSG